MAQDYTRPQTGFRFHFGGIKLNDTADSLPPGKYAYAQNVRGYTDQSLQTRPGQLQKFSTGGRVITDIGSYVTLLTDGLPRYLARDGSDRIYLDTGAQVGTLAGSGASLGATFIPFRPNQSPNPWLYVANGYDYQKFSAPVASGPPVTARHVGIAEPQTAPSAAPIGQIQSLVPNNPSWAAAGAAGSLASGSRITDTVGAVFNDPASFNAYCTFTVSPTVQYQRGMILTIAGQYQYIVQDVFPPMPTPITISAISYFAGTSGRCVVVPANVAGSPGQEGTSIYTQALLNVLRRGAIVQFSGGSEQCFVLSSTLGPDGTVCFETTTINTHAAGETVTMLPAVAVFTPPAPGAAITCPDIGVVISGANAIGTVTSGSGAFTGSFFSSGGDSFQPEDYLHFSLFIDSLQDVQQVQIAFDVGDGSFTQNYYYYSVRANDIQAALASVGVTPTQSQLAMVQTLSQRARIDLELANETGNQGLTSSGKQAAPGSSQWSEIRFPISALTRVGNDQTKTLQNANAVQLLFQSNSVAGFTAHFNSIHLTGQYQADVGDIGEPYRYRVRPRSSVTGVKGNPSPSTRYGISPRRQQVYVTLPSAAYDPQIDTWDIERFGGSITSWRFVGSIPSAGSTYFVDNFSDDAVNAGDELEFDNFEPWPSVDVPLTVTSGVTVVGTSVLVPIVGTTNVLRYLPGTLVRLGDGNVYTLYTRPTLISTGLYLMQFVESANAMTNAALYIYEPILARQFLPYMWGPDASGTVFACGDPLRPGTLSYCKNYAPDSAPDSYNTEITPPSEPLMGGEILDGLSFVGSTERWWALIPQPDNPTQRINVRQDPLPFGLVAPWAHCNDGIRIFSWAKDGIYSSADGSLTDKDLYNLFPHEGIVGKPVTYNGNTVYPPDYSRAGTFRLAYANRYLYATYQDSTGTYRALTLDLRNMAWSPDVYTGSQVSVIFHPDQQAGTLQSTTPPAYNEVVMGTTTGLVAAQAPDTNDLGGPIACILDTNEFDGGDIRAGNQWGDIFLDCLPIAAGAALVVTPMSLGVPTSAPVTISQSTSRVRTPVSVGGEDLVDFMGIQLAWSDDFTRQTASTKLYIWQPSFIPKPETIADRISDWDNCGTQHVKFIQGFRLYADTFNAVKGLAVRDSDTLSLHPFTPIVQQDGESIKAYSFVTPFFAHLVRFEPTDQLPWRFWNAEFIFENTPEFAETWETQPSVHGLKGYMHLRQISLTYSATAPVTLMVTAFDGTSPQNITLPSTGGAVQKLVSPFTFNKGQLFTYAATSSVPFQIYLDKSEVLVGGWGRQDAYVNVPLVGDVGGDHARI
jgi:hypothetical protein